MSKGSSKLTNLVIEQLVDSDYDSKKHDAYAYVCDSLVGNKSNKILQYLHRKLNKIDWEYVKNMTNFHKSFDKK